MCLGLALLAAGCSSGDDDDAGTDPGSALTPVQLCSNVALDQCDKIYSCQLTDSQLRSLGYPTTKLDCNSRALQQLACTSATQGKICQGAQTAADAASCSSQVLAANCSDVSSKPVSGYAAACGQCALRGQ
jgi:hypothetical protein